MLFLHRPLSYTMKEKKFIAKLKLLTFKKLKREFDKYKKIVNQKGSHRSRRGFLLIISLNVQFVVEKKLITDKTSALLFTSNLTKILWICVLLSRLIGIVRWLYLDLFCTLKVTKALLVLAALIDRHHKRRQKYGFI